MLMSDKSSRVFLLISTRLTVKEKNLGKAPTFAACLRFCNRFFPCFATRFFFSARLLAKGSSPASATEFLNLIIYLFFLLGNIFMFFPQEQPDRIPLIKIFN